MTRMTIVWTTLLIGGLAWPSASPGEAPRPAITVRLDRPDLQIRAVLDLFRGAKAPHPAAALSAWKRASREPNRLGKPIEALIVAFNPEMAGEVHTLDEAELVVWFPADREAPDWGLAIPGDDGSLAALATALVLSGGQAEAAIDGLAVDRLGPVGSPLMARSPRALLVGSSADGLRAAQARSEHPPDPDLGEGIRFVIAPAALEGSNSLPLRRLGAVFGPTRGPVAGTVRLVGSTLRANLTVGLDRPESIASVDPAWLDGLPIDRAALAFAVAIDPAPANWDEAFRFVDLVEKVDPARANIAPARLRLDLLARTLGLRIDGDLLPHLKGMSGWIGGDGPKIDHASVTLFLDDEATAARIVERARPLPNSGPPPRPDAGLGRWIGQVEGRPIRLRANGRSVVATWGEVPVDPPTRSCRNLLRGSPACFAALWPARLPGFVPVETPLATALGEAPPIVWSGAWRDATSFRVQADWPGLDVAVRRFLGLIPLDPPTDH
jgi:hypothetical protein